MKRKYIYAIIILLIIFILILLSKNLLIKSYIISKVEKATLNDTFTRESYLDNDLQVVEYVNNGIVLYEYFDENDTKKDVIDLQDFNSKKIYSINTTDNTIISTENFTVDSEDEEIQFNQNKTLYEDIKTGKLTNFKFNTVGETKYIVFQIYQKENSNYEIFFLNLNTNFIDKVIMISEYQNSYTSVTRSYNIINEENSSKIDEYVKLTKNPK